MRLIDELTVVVELLSDDAKRIGLTRSQIQARAELPIRKAGVELDEDAWDYLYVNVLVLTSPSGETAFRVDVHVKGLVLYANDTCKLDFLTTGLAGERSLEEWSECSAGVYGSVWHVGGMFICPTNTPKGVARHNVLEVVGNYVDDFVADYLKAHRDVDQRPPRGDRSSASSRPG